MLINEEKLRLIIRETIMLEITNFGSMSAGGTIRVEDSSEQDCPYYSSSLENLKLLIGNSQFNPLIFLYNKFGPESVKKALGDNIDFQVKLEQFLKFAGIYSNMLGTPCMAYFLLDRIMIVLLDIEEILTGRRPGGAINNSENNSQNDKKTIDYFKGINQKAILLERRSRESHNFFNSLPYYVLPNLHKLGPNNINIDEFKKDLQILAKKIDDIDDINSANVQDVHEKINKILEINETEFTKNLGEVGIGRDLEVANNLKKAGHHSALKSLSLAIEKNYKSAYESNSEFRNMANDFFNTASI